MIYLLQDRRYVGCSIGYFVFETLESFEDKELAEKECALLRRINSDSCARVVASDE